MLIKQIFMYHLVCASIVPIFRITDALTIYSLVTNLGAEAPKKEARYLNRKNWPISVTNMPSFLIYIYFKI